jgi:hypothetical protein
MGRGINIYHHQSLFPQLIFTHHLQRLAPSHRLLRDSRLNQKRQRIWSLEFSRSQTDPLARFHPLSRCRPFFPQSQHQRPHSKIGMIHIHHFTQVRVLPYIRLKMCVRERRAPLGLLAKGERAHDALRGIEPRLGMGVTVLDGVEASPGFERPCPDLGAIVTACSDS